MTNTQAHFETRLSKGIVNITKVKQLTYTTQVGRGGGGKRMYL
jgi:hypothetical protein